MTSGSRGPDPTLADQLFGIDGAARWMMAGRPGSTARRITFAGTAHIH